MNRVEKYRKSTDYWFNPTFLGLASHQWPRPEGLEAIGESQAQKSGIKAVYSPKLHDHFSKSILNVLLYPITHPICTQNDRKSAIAISLICDSKH